MLKVKRLFKVLDKISREDPSAEILWIDRVDRTTWHIKYKCGGSVKDLVVEVEPEKFRVDK